MRNELEPIVDTWYRPLDGDQPFRVTGVDEVNGLVQIQHFDGDLEEIDAGGWLALDLELAEAPTDWTGPMDNVVADDLDYSDSGTAGAEIDAPDGFTAYPEEPADPVDWDADEEAE